MQSIANLADIPDSVMGAIWAHAATESPRECCGVVIRAEAGLEYVPCANRSHNGTDTFVLDPLDYSRAEDRGEVVLVVHSHPFAAPNPSEVDRIMCGRGQTPWLIVNHPVGSAFLLQPEPYQPPLLGRTFHHGVTDCYSLVQDYYQQILSIELPTPERADNWWNAGQNLYMDNFEGAGFAQVFGQPRLHDVLLMQVRAPVPNHAAIYLGDNMIMHHMYNRLSSREVFGSFWQRATIVQLRHKDLLNADD